MEQYRIPYRVTSKYIDGGKALDWGCGKGHFSRFLATTHKNLDIFTFSFEEQPRLLREINHPVEKHTKCPLSEPERLPYDDASFSSVFSIGVLEHVHETGGDQAASLLEIRRILSPGGSFLCFHLPNKFSFNEFFANLLKKIGVFKGYTHSKKFSVNEAKKLFAENGFQVVEWNRYCFLPRNIVDKAPEGIKHNKLFNAFYELCDKILSFAFPIFCQNIYFVVKKE